MAMADAPKYKFVDNLRPPCSKCGRPLILTRIEPEEPGLTYASSSSIPIPSAELTVDCR
jgi:hypothetical protein